MLYAKRGWRGWEKRDAWRLCDVGFCTWSSAALARCPRRGFTYIAGFALVYAGDLCLGIASGCVGGEDTYAGCIARAGKPVVDAVFAGDVTVAQSVWGV